jgi:glyoxylase-like metal-dependent hydrolase (beta-lactamase superfamily II)
MSRRRIVLSRILLLVMVVLGAWVAYTQVPRAQIQKVKGDLYMVSGEGGNVAVYVTSEGVVLVDDMYDRNVADILAQVKSVTDRPIRYVFNTHQHDDHAGGNSRLLPIAEVIAHKNVRANQIAKRQPYWEDRPGTSPGLPRMTFSDETSVFLGGKEVRAKYFGRGHTNGDAVIYFPEVGVVHTGDLFLPPSFGPPVESGKTRPFSAFIFADYAQGGSFLEWTKTLDGALTLDFDTVIPGHGPVSTKREVVAFRANLEAMRNRMAGLIRSGASKSDVVNTLEEEYAWRAKGCPPSPPTPGCLQFQQVDALIAELKR